MSAISRAVGLKKPKPPAPPVPLIEPPPGPSDATPSIPNDGGVIEKIRHAAGRKKAKTGRSGTLLSGPRGIETSPTPQRKTLLGY